MGSDPAPARPAIARGAAASLIDDAPRTLAERIAERVKRHPNGEVRIFVRSGDCRSQSYIQLWSRSGQIAAKMHQTGIECGRPAVILIDDIIDFLPAFWACLRAGVTAVPLMSAGRDAINGNNDAFKQALSRLDRPYVLADRNFEPLAQALHREGIATVLTLSPETADSWAADRPSAEPPCLVPTSGATGQLKLVALAERAFLYRNFTDAHRRLEAFPHFLSVFPLDGVTGLASFYLNHSTWTQIPAAALIAQANVVLDAIEELEISALLLTNSMVKTILASEANTEPRPRSLESLKSVGLGAEPVSQRVMQEFTALLTKHGAPRDVLGAGYGTTETGTLTAREKTYRKTDSEAVELGGPAPNVDIRIVGENDQILCEREIGEVQVLCPLKIFSGYWGEPELSRSGFTHDGWWKTGDLGLLDDNKLTLHGRLKEIIIVHGKKFSLSDIDMELRTALGMEDRAYSCAVHFPNSDVEQLAIAFSSKDEDPNYVASLADRLRSTIARRYGLRADPVVAVDQHTIPLTASGKLRRAELSRLILAGEIPRKDPIVRKARDADTSPIEEQLSKIWREVLGLDGQFDKKANFFELGGDSLRSLMLYTSIEAQFGQRISAEAFFVSPTFANLLGLVANGGARSALGPEPSRVAVPWPLPDEVRNKLLIQFASWDGSRPTRDRLVAGLNLAGSRIPLFWVFQEAIEFRKVARVLGPDQPIYAFRSGLGVIKYQEDEVQALALRYVSEIEEVCPDVPVFVGGTCQGAIIALAMAQHLLRRKRHVPLLMLMEWGFPLQPYAGPVLLIHGRYSIYGNPFLRYGDPAPAFARAFPDHAIAEMPGDHDDVFEDTNVAALGEILTASMRKAGSAPPPLTAKDEFPD